MTEYRLSINELKRKNFFQELSSHKFSVVLKPLKFLLNIHKFEVTVILQFRSGIWMISIKKQNI